MSDAQRMKSEFRKNHQGQGNMSLKEFARQTAEGHLLGDIFAPYAVNWLMAKSEADCVWLASLLKQRKAIAGF